jgi:hypothetical protein
LIFTRRFAVYSIEEKIHMRFPNSNFIIAAIVLILVLTSCSGPDSRMDVTRDQLLDHIYGGWVGMLIGGLEGLPHEFKYIEEPRDSLPEFQYLPEGACTDDDNDFELTHLYFMDKENALKIPYPRIVEIWKANMNTGIWVANKNARDLMDKGFVPPATGDPENNNAASYNLSGQFCVEAYGMIAPGMPQAASDIGIHYAHIAVSGEPVQATQYWVTFISLNAFHRGPVQEVIKTALKAIDPASAMYEVVNDAILVYHDNPGDWKAARKIFYNKWLTELKWNSNSTPANGGMVILALLYGNGDFYKTLQYAMALGLDADCNAATAGAVTGVNLGYKKISALPGFNMPDIYINKTRPQLPGEMKISEQAEMFTRICERVILENEGKKIVINGSPGYRIVLQDPKIIEPLPR